MSQLKAQTQWLLKEAALKNKKKNQILLSQQYEGDGGRDPYFLYRPFDSYQKLAKILQKNKNEKMFFFEHTPGDKPCNQFYDIDGTRESLGDRFDDHLNFLKEVIQKNVEFFKKFNIKAETCATSANKFGTDNDKISAHLTFLLYNEDDERVFLKNVKVAKNIALHLFPDLVKVKVVDPVIYGDRVFRTIFSTKVNESRPLVWNDELCVGWLA